MAAARVVDVVADELAAAGVRRIYGMPGGGSNMALIGAAAARGIEFVLMHHEPAAIFAAAGEAEVTGQPTVCLATLGPGVANCVNGLAHCLLDRVPLVLISDSPGDTGYLHQRLTHSAVVGGVAKRSHTLTPENVRETVRGALAEALERPKGPVHLDLSSGVAVAEAGPDARSPEHVSPTAPVLDQAAFEAAVELLRNARRPVVLAGLNAAESGTSIALRSLLDRLRVPVLTTYKGKGSVPESHRQAAGLLTNGILEGRVLDTADAILAVGLDEVELMQGAWRWQRPTVAVGHEAAAGGQIGVSVALRGDPAETLPRLAAGLPGWESGWPEDLPSSRPSPAEMTVGSGDGLAPAEIVIAARTAAPSNTIATVDAGSHMFAATLFWQAENPASFLISNGLSTMGYALPAAIGASLTAAGRPVVCFTGDGGLAMAVGELETLARIGAAVVVVVFNDSTLNLIKIKQEKRGETTNGLDFGAIDWVSVAAGMGVAAERVSNSADLGAAFARAFNADGPYLLDVVVDASSYPRMLDVIRG